MNVFRWRSDLQRLRQVTVRKNISVLGPTQEHAPRVSFLLAAWNEETLKSCLDAILRLDYPDFEVVLCAGGTDRTWQIASELASDSRVILLRQAAGDGKQKSLARCLEHSSGEVVYLLDAGCLITASAFARMLQPIVCGKEQVVTALPCVPVPAQLTDPFAASQCASRVYTSLCQPDYCSGILGANSAIRRSALDRAGGFAGEARTGVDYDLGKRLRQAGLRIRYDALAFFPMRFRTEIGPYLRQQSRWLRNVVIHGSRFGEYREVASCLISSLTGAGMLASPFAIAGSALSPAVPRTAVEWFAATWIAAFSHAFFSRVRYLKLAGLWLRQSWAPATIALLPVFIFIDFLAWTIPLFEYPWKNRRDRW